MSLTNQLKTVILLGMLTGLLLGAGQLIGGRSGLLIGLVFAGVMNFGSYWFSDKIVLAMYRAKQVTPAEAPELHGIVDDILQRANMPKPKVYIVPSAQPNAFATGRSPKHAAIAATEGIMQLLNKEELKGVLAHELSHVKNRDVLVTTIAATIAGVISYLAMMAQWAAIFGGFGGRDNRGSNNILGVLALAIITPLIASMLQLAISRSREFLADESGARMVQNAHGLASALQKIEEGVRKTPMRMGNESTSSLFIANPFRGSGIMHLLSTHPPTAERVKRLHNLRL